MHYFIFFIYATTELKSQNELHEKKLNVIRCIFVDERK